METCICLNFDTNWLNSLFHSLLHSFDRGIECLRQKIFFECLRVIKTCLHTDIHLKMVEKVSWRLGFQKLHRNE